MENKDVIIIGGGPAGLTAAIYAGRAQKSVTVIEKGAPGGKMNNTHQIDNYPGMEGKQGFEYSMSWTQQAKNFGAEIKGGDVAEITNLDSVDNKIIKLANGEELSAKTIIIAAGLKSKPLNVPGYEEYFGKGVGVCVVCDAAFYRGKKIAVIGGGNSATEESLYASNIVGEIEIINSFPGFRCEEVTLDKLNAKENVNIHHNTSVKSINGTDGKVSSITIEENGIEKNIEVSGVFTYIGWDVENYFIKDKDMFDDQGYIKVNNDTTETKYPGVYAAGDITPKPFRQVTIAASEGTKSALAAIDYINKL